MVREGELKVYAKDLEDGTKAVGLFNPGAAGSALVTVKWSELGISGRHTVRDLWRQKDLGPFEGRFAVNVAPHGTELVKITPEAAL